MDYVLDYYDNKKNILLRKKYRKIFQINNIIL